MARNMHRTLLVQVVCLLPDESFPSGKTPPCLKIKPFSLRLKLCMVPLEVVQNNG